VPAATPQTLIEPIRVLQQPAESAATEPARSDQRQLVGAAVFGALSMLIGVLVGVRIGRHRG